jgi:transcriptional regulator with XRE-family HTH domain
MTPEECAAAAEALAEHSRRHTDQGNEGDERIAAHSARQALVYAVLALRPGPARPAEATVTAVSPSMESREPLKLRVAAAIRERRKERGLTLQQVADALEAAGHALPMNSVWKIERGERRVDLDDLEALAEVLDVDPADLLRTPSVMADTRRALTSANAADAAWNSYAHARSVVEEEYGPLVPLPQPGAPS